MTKANSSGQPEAARERDDDHPDVGAEGVERPVGEVQDVHQAPDDGQPGGDEEQHRADGQALQRLDGDRLHVIPPRWASRAPRAASQRYEPGGDAQVAGAQLLVGLQRVGAEAADDASFVHHVVLLGHLHCRAHVLLDEQDGGAVGADLADRLEQGLHDQRRQPLARLVEQQQLRPGHQRPRDGELLLLAAAQATAGLAAGARAGSESTRTRARRCARRARGRSAAPRRPRGSRAR